MDVIVHKLLHHFLSKVNVTIAMEIIATVTIQNFVICVFHFWTAFVILLLNSVIKDLKIYCTWALIFT
jgi:hypothetical protein